MFKGTDRVHQAMLRLSAAALIAFVAAPSTAQQPVAPLKAPSRAYTVNAGDEIEIYVWGEERLQRQLKVLPDGTFSFPLVGRVMAQGMLPSQIEAAIAAGLASQYRGQVPQVTVSVRSTVGFTFSVIGRVRSAGQFSPGRYVNVLEALSMAGGGDEFANLDGVTIIRKTDRGATTIRSRLGGVMKGNLSSDAAANLPQIESGDTVIVP
jgi:polysaccharide biosynthesis/export protein